MRLPLWSALVLVAPHYAQAVVISPYSQNFDGYLVDGATDFEESNTGAFVIVTQSAGDQAYRARIQSSSSASAAVQVVGSGGGDFSVSTDIRLTELATGTGASSINLSLAAAGTNATFGSTEYRVVMDFFTGGFLLLRNNAAVAFTTSSGTIPTVTVGSNYSVTFSGDYTSPTVALLSMSITDGTNTFSATYNDNAALSGSYFGYRIAKNGTGTTLGTELDQFSLTAAVPEASSSVMIAGGLAGLLLRRRRR